MKPLEGKRILVTGAGTGIGLGICRLFARQAHRPDKLVFNRTVGLRDMWAKEAKK